MGVVYLAHDEALLRPTAVKVLSWAFLESHGNQPESWFLAEARSVARINHPAVIQVYSAAKHGAYCYIAMEYVEGVPGDALVTRKGPLLVADATQAILQIAGALDLAHTCNIVHRDVKPANILIKLDGTAKLGDFGMALHSASAEPNTRTPMGTPQYIAPEIWQGGAATPLTDIYALGATYYHFLVGRPPFETSDLQTLIDLHQRGTVPALTMLDPAVASDCQRIIRKCMAKSPAARYQSAQELGWDLRGVLRRLHGRHAAELTPPLITREASGGHETAESAIEPWATVLGLSGLPFVPISSRRSPYHGEPFARLRQQVSAFLLGKAGRTLLITGEHGSGRTLLARQCVVEAPAGASVAYVDVKYGKQSPTKTRTLAQGACRALGALPSTSSGRDPDLEGLVDHISASPDPTLLVLDAVPTREVFVQELFSLIRVANSTKCMSLVVIGGADLAERLVAKDGIESDAIITLAIPALDVQQTAGYIAAWLEATRGRGALPLIITPDAAALIHYRCEGNLVRINSLARNMLRIAALENRRVLPSWYAWLAPVEEGWVPEENMQLQPPLEWPASDVLEILNAYRGQLDIEHRHVGDGLEDLV
jgi:serine/threonine protein kinase